MKKRNKTKPYWYLYTYNYCPVCGREENTKNECIVKTKKERR